MKISSDIARLLGLPKRYWEISDKRSRLDIFNGVGAVLLSEDVSNKVATEHAVLELQSAFSSSKKIGYFVSVTEIDDIKQKICEENISVFEKCKNVEFLVIDGLIFSIRLNEREIRILSELVFYRYDWMKFTVFTMYGVSDKLFQKSLRATLGDGLGAFILNNYKVVKVK